MGIVKSIVEPAEEYALSDAPSERTAAAPQAVPALEEIFRRHHPRIVDMLSRLTGDRGRAEDIAGDVFCKLVRRGSMAGVGEGLAGWVYRVAANAGFDALRSGARRRRREEAAGVESLRAAEPTGALEDLVRAERRAQVRRTLAALKPRDARLLLLRSGGAAYREIAEALGIAPASVGTLLARAEAAFERKFRARYGDWR